MTLHVEDEFALAAARVTYPRLSELKVQRGLGFQFEESRASRLAARFAADSGTGENSPFEAESSLIGRRAPPGSTAGFTRPV